MESSKLDVQYLDLMQQPPFIIKVNRKEYQCNSLGVNSSKIIHDFRIQNPDTNQYEYKYENKNDEFQFICDIFNFKQVQITTKNMNFLLHICEELQIDAFIDKISSFIELYESIIQESDIIDEIFTWLYQIQTLTVINVKNSIIDSIWVQTEENIQELAAMILQVIGSNGQIHSQILELIQLLDKSSNEDEKLSLLMPFIINRLKHIFFKSNLYCSFVYKMIQKNLISMKEIIDIIVKTDPIFSSNSNAQSKQKIQIFDIEKFELSHHSNVVIWFFPELHELKNIPKEKILKGLADYELKIIQSYFPDKIELYKKLRDSGEPENELEKSILHDDVDSFQKIVSKNRIDINKGVIQPRIFDGFELGLTKSFINYACECGSIKCFKYLLLNHATVDQLTYGFAIYGGNTEIVRIIDQKINNKEVTSKSTFKKVPANNRNNLANNNNNNRNNWNNNAGHGGNRNGWQGNNNNNNNNNNAGRANAFARANQNAANQQNNNNQTVASISTMNVFANPIIFTIKMHKYDLFDWIMEQKMATKQSLDFLLNMATISVKNGNVHSFIQFIDNGLILSRNQKESIDFITTSSVSGYYRFTKLLLSLCNFNNDIFGKVTSSTGLLFGNLSIFKLFYNNKKSLKLLFDSFLFNAIHLNYLSIIKYLIEDVFEPNEVNIKTFIFEAAISLETPTIFNYLESKFSLDYLSKGKFTCDHFLQLLIKGCQSGNAEAVYKIIDFVKGKYPKLNLTKAFITAGSSGNEEICQYLVDKNANLNVNEILQNYRILASKIGKIILNFLNSSDQKVKETFSKFFLNEAIAQGNTNLANILINKESLDDQALFDAVKSRNIEIVKMVLKCNDKPSFINQLAHEGTVLNIAVNNNDIQIVQLLLSLPGIDPNLRNNEGSTPLASAIIKLNIKMVNVLLDFYGDKILSQEWQIKKAIRSFIKKNNYKDPKIRELYPVIDRLVQIKNINLNFYVGNQTLLLLACQYNDRNLVTSLLKSELIDVNLYDLRTSDTPLIVAVNNSNFDISQLLLEHPNTNINFKNANFLTALTIAVKNKFDKIIPLIISDDRFDPEESNLDFAFYTSEGRISKNLISAKGLNVNYKCSQGSRSNYLFETCLARAINQNDAEKVEMIITHQSFDPIESFASDSIFNVFFVTHFELLKKLLQITNNDINMRSSSGKSLFSYYAERGKESLIKEFLNNKDFKPTKDDFIKAFLRNYSIQYGNSLNASIESMELMVKYDEEHDHFIDFSKLMNNGKSFYTSIDTNLNNIDDVVQFFLDHNVDPNAPDDSGIYPLEYGIVNNSYRFVTTLLNSNKIDFSKELIDGKNYNTIIANCSDNDILNEFVDKKIIDSNLAEYINAKNGLCNDQSNISYFIQELIIISSDTDFQITYELVIRNFKLFGRLLNKFNIDLDEMSDINYQKKINFAKIFYQAVTNSNSNILFSNSDDINASDA